MLEVYKKGQGTRARWVAAVALGAMALFGCYELQEMLSRRLSDDAPLNLGVTAIPLSVVISALAFLAAAVAVAWVVNSRRSANYLITSEMELRKVSWPTRTELKRQTAVVIVTLIFFGLVLLAADIFFVNGSRWLYGF